MKEIACEIRNTIDEASVLLSLMKPEEVTFKEGPEEWSKKEILGHLIDSAANNHQRFVRAASNPGEVTIHSYNQNDWVRIQQYDDMEWDELLELWIAYNRHLSHVIECIPENAFHALCNIGKPEPVMLEFVIKDYLRHIRHHLADLLK